MPCSCLYLSKDLKCLCLYFSSAMISKPVIAALYKKYSSPPPKMYPVWGLMSSYLYAAIYTV